MRTLIHGLSDLKAHPWRACLSGFSLLIGVLAVVAIFTIGEITAEVFIAASEQREGRRITATADCKLREPTAERVRASVDAATVVTASGGGAALVGRPVSGAVADPATASLGQPMEAADVILVAGRLDSIRRLPIVAGRWLDGRADFPIELTLNRLAAAKWGGVGTQLAVLASPEHPPVRAVVVGVTADGRSERNVYMAMPALLNAQPGSISDGLVSIYLHHRTADLDRLTQVAQLMANAGACDLAPGRLNRVDTVDLLLGQLRTQQRAFLGVALLALLVAAVGMLNIGLASITERARELVVRRAVGATRAAILSQILIAALVVGVVAACLAILIAAGGVQWWVPRNIPPESAIVPPSVPWTAMLWGTVAAATTTLVGASIPAVVAARLDIATALRD